MVVPSTLIHLPYTLNPEFPALFARRDANHVSDESVTVHRVEHALQHGAVGSWRVHGEHVLATTVRAGSGQRGIGSNATL